MLDTARDRVLVIDDCSPDGTGEIADRLAAELAWVVVLHRDGEGRHRARVRRRLPPGARGRRRARARDGLRLLARPGRRPAADRGDGRRRRPRPRLALREGGGTANWGLGRRFVSRGGCLYAQVILGVRVRDLTGGFKCFRRDGARGDRPRRALRARLRVPDRDDVPRSCRAGLRVSRGADHVRRTARRRVEDDAARSSPRRCGRCRCSGCARSPASL